MQKQSLELLSFSAGETSRRLQFYRLCFGAAGGPAGTTSIGEARRAAAGFFEGRKQVLNWQTDTFDEMRIPQTSVQLILNLVLLAGEALPRGGQIDVELAGDGSRIRIDASGKSAGLREDDIAALSGEVPLASLDARTIQPWYSASIGREIGAGISVEQAPGESVCLQAAPVFAVSA